MKELELINYIRRNAGKPSKGLIKGIGDDSAVLAYDKTRHLLWAQDMLVEDTHFTLGEISYQDIGRKAVAVNISDIAAMGGMPKFILISIGIPPKMGLKKIKLLYKGIFDICGEYGIKVIGGDTNKSEKLVIDVSILGLAEKKELVLRSGARVNDLVLITGPIRDGKKEHAKFIPCLKESRFLVKNYKINSMIDVSDGIAMDVRRICAESGTGCVIYSGALPLSKGLSLKDALYYGESFELLFTIGLKEAKRLFVDMGRRRNAPLVFLIGEVTDKRKGFKLIADEGRVEELEMKGFRHI